MYIYGIASGKVTTVTIIHLQSDKMCHTSQFVVHDIDLIIIL